MHRSSTRSVALFDREEAGREPPYGPALDVGTGSGIWASSWHSAAGRSPGSTSSRRPCGAPATEPEADADVRLVRGDVTALRAASVGTGFRLVLETAFHGLTAEQRKAMGQEITRRHSTERNHPHDRMAQASSPTHTRGDPERHQSRLPQLDGDRGRRLRLPPPKPLDLLLRPDEDWYRLHRE